MTSMNKRYALSAHKLKPEIKLTESNRSIHAGTVKFFYKCL